jgi:hypothetical protein
MHAQFAATLRGFRFWPLALFGGCCLSCGNCSRNRARLAWIG